MILTGCQCPLVRHRHGTRAAYRAHGCECLPCRAANAQYSTANRAGESLARDYRRDPTGSVRRLRALHAAGWEWSELALRLDTRPQVLRRLALSKVPWVYPGTLERISALYAELCMRESPIAAGRTKAMRSSIRQGWLPADCWEDVNIDDPAEEPNLAGLAGKASGYPYNVRTAIAVQLMREFPDITQRDIAARASVGDKTVRRLERSEA